MSGAGAARGAHAALTVVFAGALVAPLDTSVNVAFPAITEAFRLELPSIRWLVIVYTLSYGCLMLVGGRLGDLHGYRRIFGAGLAVTALSLAGCAAAKSYEFLLLARAGQGLGVALILGCGPALALSLFPPGARTRVLGWYASMFALGNAIGLAAGGALIVALGWQAIFWLRVPLALAALALLLSLPASREAPRRRPFDLPGAALLALWTAGLVLALAVTGAARAWLVTLAIAGFAGFVARESRVAEPILRLALFRDREFAAMNVLCVAANLAGFTMMLLGPYYFVRVSGLPVSGVGLLLAIAATGTLAGAALAARLGRNRGLRAIGLAGVALCIAGLGLAATWDAGTPPSAAALSLLVQGFGMGLFQVAYTDAVVSALPAEDRGVAGGLTMLTRVLGVSGGATIFASLFDYGEGAALAAGAAAAEAFLEGFRFAFRSAAVGLGACLFTVVLIGRCRAVGER